MATTSTSTPPGSNPALPADASPGESFLTPQRIRILGMGGAAVLVIALVAWFVITAGRRKEAFAATELERARDAAVQNNCGVAVQGFTRVASTYSGTAAAYEAALGIAQCRLVTGQNELAIASLSDFLKTNPPPLYSAPGQNLLGTAYENTGKYAEAEGAYKKAADLATVDYLKASSLLDAARAANLDHKVDDAKSIYNDIIAKYSKTAAMTEAQIRLAELTASTS